MNRTSKVIALVAQLGCGTGLEEGPPVQVTAPTDWQLNFDDPAVLETALQESECIDPSAWRVAEGHLALTAACLPVPDAENPKLVTGTMIRFPSGRFGEGWLVARVFPGAAATWGLVWGPERAYFLLSAYRNTERVALAVVATPGADFAGNLNVAAPETRRYNILSSMAPVRIAFNAWSDVAVHRSPERTTIYFDKVPVLWFVGDAGWEGPVGFYTSRMDSFLVDSVAIYAPGPPPWERLDAGNAATPP